MFTDWSNAVEGARYFYFRGALWGFVVATFLYNVVIPWVKEKIRQRN